MRRILLIDFSTSGHHMNYINGILQNADFEFYGIFPRSVEQYDVKNIRIYQVDYQRRFSQYRKAIALAHRIVKEKQIDLVHWLDGDSIMRYFGYGMNFGNKVASIITYHNFYPGTARKAAYRLMLRKRGNAIVHTSTMRCLMNETGINNCSVVEYPSFAYDEIKKRSKKKCREELHLPINKRIVSMLGATSNYKGYDTVFDALHFLKDSYVFVFAGKEADYTKEMIEAAFKSQNSSAETRLGWMTDDDYINYIVASDIILVPYEKAFFGASGILVDGMAADKTIVGSDTGSIGEIINTYNKGYTCEPACAESLANALNSCEKIKTKGNEFEVQTLTPQHFSEEYKNVYQTLI